MRINSIEEYRRVAAERKAERAEAKRVAELVEKQIDEFEAMGNHGMAAAIRRFQTTGTMGMIE